MAYTTESKDLNLSDVIDSIYEGEYQLPEFQRDYVWKDSNIKSLFESVLSSHPIGTILVLEIEKDDPLIAWINFAEIIPDEKKRFDYKEVDREPPSYLVLDGQQRLTSLCHLTHGTATSIWYLDLNPIKIAWEDSGKPSEKDEIKNFVEQSIDIAEYIKKGKKTDDPVKYFRGAAKRLPLQLLKDKNTLNKAITDVRDAISSKITEKQYELKNYKKLTPKETKEELEAIITEDEGWKEFLGDLLPFILDNYFDYKIPTVVVSKKMGITGVCKVFTKINTTGIQLGAFDLIVAVLYPKKISLKQKFDDVIETYPLINALDGTAKRYLLQTLALYKKVSPKTSQLPVTLLPEWFSIDWDKCVDNLNNACELIDENCGSSLSKGTDQFLTYSPLLPVIANVIDKYPVEVSKNAILTVLRKNKLRAWYYGAGLSSRYSEGSDNKQVKDLPEMLKWFASGSFDEDRPKWLDAIYSDINTGKSNAIGKTVVSLFNLKKAKDIYSDSQEVGAHRTDCDLHHIFPKAAMRNKLMAERGIKDKSVADKILKNEYNIDSILNQTWLLSTTNRDIVCDRMPSHYIADLIEQNGGGENGLKKVKDLFNDHCVGESCFNYLIEDNYFGFIEERRKDINRELMTTGKIPKILETEIEDSEIDE
ncbi:DUF262 domain-containing protein [Flavobacterium sp. CSZ]|uniref:GmrSD restriction endonuclease domain-containing protein n=1 Tax=Flavobacterium sp. CSZ TaxID=2783791 RepID=UPI00188CEA36|nr:DUF262 domain-containing protein [Flavobacterium sp. CSZ]MBF4485147.1 DUF262 domain-containing protein [Flavobacterium sp. CSZ]